MLPLDQRGDAVNILRKGVLAGDEVPDWPPESFIYSHDGRTLHKVLDGWNRFRIAGMKIEVAVPDGECRPAAVAHQPAWAAETMAGMI